MPALTLKANLYWWQRIDVAWGFVLLVAVNRWSMEVCFWPNVAVVAAEKPSYMENLIGTSPVDCEENRWSSNKYQAAAWHFRVHTSVSVASLSPVYQNGWPYVWTSILNWYKIQLFFFQNASVVLPDFQTQSDPLWRPVAPQGRGCDVQLLVNKCLFWSLLSPNQVPAWGFSTPVCMERYN